MSRIVNEEKNMVFDDSKSKCKDIEQAKAFILQINVYFVSSRPAELYVPDFHRVSLNKVVSPPRFELELNGSKPFVLPLHHRDL